MSSVRHLRLERLHASAALDETQIRALAACDDLSALMSVSGALARAGHGDAVTYSRKVFIPLTIVWLVVIAAWMQTPWNPWK